MPTYQYACTDADCGNEFELVQSFTDPAASECPACHGPVRKVFSAVGVVFKGSGFYRTDSRAANSGGGKGSDGSGSGASGKSGDGKSNESKSGDGGSASKPADSSGASSSTSPSSSSTTSSTAAATS